MNDKYCNLIQIWLRNAAGVWRSLVFIISFSQDFCLIMQMRMIIVHISLIWLFL